MKPGTFDGFFKQKQRLDEYGLVELLTDFDLFVEAGEVFLDKYDKSKEFTNYVTISDFQ